MNTGISAINDAVKEAGSFVHPLFNELGKVIIGQTYLVERLVIGLLANGHVLLEGVPGLAKTLSVKSLANCLHVKFSRLQFTPDMLPADVIGTLIYNPQSGGFSTRKGPIFANLVLADEISTARRPRCKALLLEAMQEKTGHHRRPNLPPRGTLSRFGNAESHRAGRDLSLARSAG